MNNAAPETFEYKDRDFGDTTSIVVKTRPAVFYPTSTTSLLLSGVRKFVNPHATSVLDLGCGSGIVAVVLAKLILPRAAVHASDISEDAVELARQNAEDNQVKVECRSGSLFEPWSGKKFDVIVDDVAGMAEPIARFSRWYPPHIHSDAEEDGTRWIVRILARAGDFLALGGQFFFPVLTLSDQAKIMETAKKYFAKIDLLAEQWYPLGDDLLPHLDVVENLVARNIIEVKKKGSRWLWATKVYLAANPA